MRKCAALLVLLCLCRVSPAADTNTWQHRLLDRVLRIESTMPADSVKPFINTMCRHDKPLEITMDVGGAKEIYLFVLGIPDVKWAVADWADARLVMRDGQVMHLAPGKNCEVLLGRYEKDLTLRSGLY